METSRYEDIGWFEEVLKEHYKLVFNTGSTQNKVEPKKGWYRAYFTAIGEEDNPDE